MRPKSHYRHMNQNLAQLARRLYFVEKMKQKMIGDLLGVKQNTVSRIVSGHVWRAG